MRMISVALATVFALSGCATNMATVGAFSKSTQELAGQSVDMLSKYAGQCGERLAIVEHERTVLDQADVFWSSSAKAKPAEAKQALATIAKARESLKPYDAGLKTTCPEQTRKLTAARSIGEVLLNYANGLQALSSDNFVTYNPKLDGIPDSLAKLPGSDGKALLDSAQVGAVRDLAKLVYKIAIMSYRQKQLEQAMGPAQGEQLANVKRSLAYLTSSYLQGLDKEQIELNGLSSDLGALMQAGVLPEPLSVTEVQRQLQMAVADVAKRQKAMQAYAEALDKFGAGFDKAALSIRQPPTQDIARDVIDFGKAVYNVQTALDKAF